MRAYRLSAALSMIFVLLIFVTIGAAQKVRPPAVRSGLLASTDWVAKNLNNSTVIILHVAREKSGYDSGHIPGARFVGWSDIVATRDGIPNELPPVEQLQKFFENLGIGDRARIILYGDNNGLSAARAFYTLDYLGHADRAALLDGGMEKWKTENRKIDSQPAKYSPAKFTPRLKTELAVEFDAMRDLSWVAANLPNPDVTIIDARPEEQYIGSPGQRSGHIPGAANVFWMNHLIGKDNLSLKPASELRKMYEAAGLKPSDKVVTYCNTGVQASHAYFTLKYLGYDVMMYDASFTEWGKKEGAAVVTGKLKN